MTAPVDAVVIVVPARNEEALLRRCLVALTGATARFHILFPHVPVSVTVVLDRTTDASDQVIADFAQVEVVHSDAGCVGAARNIGIRRALENTGAPAGHTWILNTDADSVVPRDWIEQHWRLGLEGWDVVVGTVEPVRQELSAHQHLLWRQAHTLAEGHPHIHGANLAFRASAYRELGGFKSIPVHEDREFVHAARAGGLRVRATDLTRIRTSGRHHSTVHNGFASYLSRLPALEVPAEP